MKHRHATVPWPTLGSIHRGLFHSGASIDSRFWIYRPFRHQMLGRKRAAKDMHNLRVAHGNLNDVWTFILPHVGFALTSKADEVLSLKTRSHCPLRMSQHVSLRDSTFTFCFPLSRPLECQ